MGIGKIVSADSSFSVMQTTSAKMTDQKSKSIQTEITDVQQQLRKLSSDEELSVSEKAGERRKLQKEKSSLDTELKQHQEELLRSQKREIRLAQLQENRNPEKEEEEENASSDTADEKIFPSDGRQNAQPGTIIAQNSDGTVILKEIMNQAGNIGGDAEKTAADEAKEEAAVQEEAEAAGSAKPIADVRPTAEEMQTMISADSSAQLAARQGTLVAKTDDGIAILKGEIKQDEARGVDTERKQAELAEMQKQKQREMAFQFSVLGEANNMAQEEQAYQQGFQVSIA